MLKPKLIFAFLFIVTLFPYRSLAQTGQISGFVTDQYSGELLPNTNVVILGTNIGVAADNNGHFVLRNIPVGKYVVQVSRIGYQTKQYEIKITGGQEVSMNLPLQAEAVKFREVLVTATRENTLRSEVAVATEIITRAEIEQTGAQNIGEILEYASGVFVKNYGHMGALKTVSIRGASENQVLVLLDGQRLNLAQGIAPDLSDIPLQAIARIEIIRGGHSALYGTDAVGGVINLITRSFAGQKAVTGRVNSTIASFGTQVVEANFGQKLGALDYFVAHNYTDGDGDFKYEDSEGRIVKRTNNKFRWNDTFFKLRYAFDSSALVQGFVQFHNAERGVPGPLGFPSEVAIQKDDSWKSNVRYEHKLASNLNFVAQTFFHKFNQTFDDSSAFIPIQSQHQNDEFGLSLQSDWRVSSVTDITGGYEFRQDKINSTDIASQKRTSHSVYLQNQIKLPMQWVWTMAHLRLIPAFRLDKYNDADVQFSPKIGFIFSYVTDLQILLRGNWGRSYRIPSFNDLYWPAGAFTAGNPALIPESGTGFDIGFLLNFSKKGYWGLEVNYFNTNLDNLIIWGPRQDGVWSPQNVQQAKINGVEAKLSFQDAGELFNFEANYNYLKAVDAGDDQSLHGNQLIYRPKHKVDLNLLIHFSRLELTGTYHFVSQRFTAMDNSFALQEYSIVNVGGAWLQPIVGGHLKIQVEVRNLNDQQIQIIADFPAPGREYRTTVGFAF